MKTIRLTPLLAALTLAFATTLNAAEKPLKIPATVDSLFSAEEILDESTLDIKILQDWHVDEATGSTRQKLIEINVAELWPGQDYRIPVRMTVPLKGKAKGFRITGANSYEGLMEDSKPSEFEAKLLAGGVGIVQTVVKPLRQIPGKRNLQRQMMAMMQKERNPRYTTVWMWSMTLMRATTAAYAETDYFEKGKVAGSGSSKNGISPAVALINDERFTATCSNHAFAYYSPARRRDREVTAKADAANKAFFEAVEAGDADLDQARAKLFQRVMVKSRSSVDMEAGRSVDEMQKFADRLMPNVCVTENWDRLMERGVDILFEPGTHDYVAYDIVWGAQNHPQLPVYYQPNGGHSQTPHVAVAEDEQNREAFLWHHFFGGDPLLKPPTSSHKVDKDKLSVSVSFKEGPQPISGRIWWIYDRAPEGSAPFLHVLIPEDQWADMERDPKTGSWTATIPLKEGASRIDFFSNHGHMANGYKQYLSSPYTRVELSAEAYSKTQRKPAAAPSTNAQAQQPSEKQLTQILKRFPEADTDKDGKLNAEEIQQFRKSRQRNTRPATAAQPTQATNAQSQQPSEEQLARILKRFPEADKDKDGKLNTEEIQQFLKSRQRNRRPAAAAQPTQAGDAKLAETLAGMNARFKNVEVELLEWPAELHEKLGKMTKLALVTRPVEKIEGKLPLLINLHGGGQRWWNNSFQQQLAIAAQMGMKRGFDLAELAGKGLIVLDPNTAERWKADSLDTMLDYFLANYPEIDKDRVYVMGYSAGGGATWRWINQSADRFAAAAPCGFTGGSAKDDAKKLAKLPIWAMAGGDDGKNPAGIRKMVERLKAAGNVNVKHTEFEGADHRAGGRAVFGTVELVDWMLGFKRPKTTE
jgi:Ca2+-binding EF-hand superfamily protein/pimeloyl-ACP methyl ester carboxylesterase